MRAFRAGVPWESVAPLVDLLDSHDTARFRTVAGTRERHLVGVGLQMTLPGVPMVFAGDELGLEGQWGEDARRHDAVGRARNWDEDLLERVARARRAAPLERRARARRHPLRARRADAIAFLRETQGRAAALPRRARPARPDRAASVRPALETLYGDDGRRGGAPAGGPAFHIWRIAMADVAFNEVDKIYDNGVQAVFDLTLEITTASSSCSSARRAAARRPRCAWSPGSRTSPPARIDRRARRERPVAEGARHRDGLPELRALPALGRREHRLRAAPPQDGEERDQRARHVGGEAARPDPVPRPAGRRSCRAGSASVWRWAARSSATRRSS